MTFAKKSDLYKYGISPNKLFEYLASSKPIIFSGNIYNDIVKIADAGISVEAENKKELLNSILYVKNLSKEENIKLGVNGRIYLEKNFTNYLLKKKLIQVIEN